MKMKWWMKWWFKPFVRLCQKYDIGKIGNRYFFYKIAREWDKFADEEKEREKDNRQPIKTTKAVNTKGQDKIALLYQVGFLFGAGLLNQKKPDKYKVN